MNCKSSRRRRECGHGVGSSLIFSVVRYSKKHLFLLQVLDAEASKFSDALVWATIGRASSGSL